MTSSATQPQPPGAAAPAEPKWWPVAATALLSAPLAGAQPVRA